MLSNIAYVINVRLARVLARPHHAVISAHLPRDEPTSISGFFAAAAAAAKCDSSRRATMSTDIDIAILQISAKPGTRRACSRLRSGITRTEENWLGMVQGIPQDRRGERRVRGQSVLENTN